MAEDPFVVLGVNEDANEKKVQSAFRRLALQCHPDRHPKDPLAKARFLRLSRAKETLLDPFKRRVAEHLRHGARQQQSWRSTPKKSEKSSLKRPVQKQSQHEREMAEKRRRVSAEQLRKREMDAEAKRRRDEVEARRRQAAEVADLKRRCAKLYEQKVQERIAQRERQKADLFDAFLQRRKLNAAQPSSQAARPVLGALVDRFAASSDQLLVIPLPLSAAERQEIIAAVKRYNFQSTENAESFYVHRGSDGSKDDSQHTFSPSAQHPPAVHSAWADSHHAQDEVKQKQPRRTSAAAKTDPEAEARHREAIKRLYERRNSGEGLPRTPQGSWWIRDEEAERWAQYVDRSGF